MVARHVPNALDRVISWVSPGWALKRSRERARWVAYTRDYTATQPTPDRRGYRSSGDANKSVEQGLESIREQARHLERNHDLARGVLSTLVRNTIGAHGIQVEPQPRRLDGSIHDEYAEELRELHRDWGLRPEVTWRYDDPAMQRVLGRSLYRDGEVFAQELAGPIATLDHGTRVPYSVEMMEADLVPVDLNDPEAGIVQGIEHNTWGRPRQFWVYRTHPGALYRGRHRLASRQDLKAVPAQRMRHAALRDRIGQVRGMSLFASVLARLENLQDYEDSEQIAAKVAASMAAYITKGNPDVYDPPDTRSPDYVPRAEMTFVPGMVFDDLLPGESIGTIDTSRPNANLEAHRNGQLLGAASGTEVAGSSLSKDYSRTNFSGARQEMVEQWAAYAVLAAGFSNDMVRPFYRGVVSSGVAAGVTRVPADLDLDTLYDALYSPVPMPWVDPRNEAQGQRILQEDMVTSAIEVIRKRGQVPRDVVDQIARWDRMLADAGVSPRARASEAPEAPETGEQDAAGFA